MPAGLFGKIYRDIKRGMIILMVFLLAGSVIYSVIVYGVRKSRTRISAIVDIYSGDNLTDRIALSRILADPEFELIGLTESMNSRNSTWFHNMDSLHVEKNEKFLEIFGRSDIPLTRGGEPVISDSRQMNSSGSEAARFIVSKALKASPKKKLNIIALGALTNIAAAVKLDSGIISRIRVYTLVMQYTPRTRVWNKNETNARNDLDALDFILNSEDIEMHIMPASVARTMSLEAKIVRKAAGGRGTSWTYLTDEWTTKHPESEELAVPSLALISAIINPDFAKVENTITPPENKRKTIHVYTWINKEFMKIDFIETMKKSVKQVGKQTV
jgi:inosine-uridine nucleoside N-ribohydrolase